MSSLYRLSQRLGIVATVLGVFVWILLGAAVARGGVAVLWQYPRLGYVLVLIVAGVVGVGGLFGFWFVAELIDYWRRGYRVRWLTENEYVYEEVAEAGARSFPISREVLASGYPAPCRVRMPTEASWASEVPAWARGRRGQIATRIAECFGADRGANVQFSEE